MTEPSVHHHSDLLSTGLSHRDIVRATATGDLEHLRHGVYLRGGGEDELVRHRALILATDALVDPSNVVSHQSAALLHGLPLPRGQLERVTMTRRSAGHGDTGTHLLLRKTRIDADEVTVVGGFRVTSLARTAIDLARALPFEWGVAACDAALRMGLSPLDLRSAVSRHRRLRGLPKARRVVDFSDADAESPAESLSRVVLTRQGLPTPELQFEVIDADGVLVARADFGWPAYRLVGEADGRWKYGELLRPGESAADAVMREKRREERIRQAGYWVVRWDWDAIMTPAALATMVRNALASQARLLGL